jgi:long-chain fatty acid transport protein
MRRSAVLSAATLLAAIVLAPSAQAQGFSVYEHDACAMGRAGTGVASPCSGGSAIFFNPAGIVGGTAKWNFQAGVTAIAPTGSFTDSATGTVTNLVKHTFPVPAGYLTRQLGPLAVGVGVFVPYGLTTEWPQTFAGRFLSYKATIQAIYIQPTLAWAVSPRFSIGAGFDIVPTSIEIKQHLDLASQVADPTKGILFGQLGIPTGTDFADARLKATGTGYGAHFGVIARPTDWLSVGGRFLSTVNIDLKGTGTFSQILTGINLPPGNPIVPGGAAAPLDAVLVSNGVFSNKLATQGATASLPLPAQIVVGVALQPTRSLRLLGDYQWTMWQQFSTVPIKLDSIGADTLFENYRWTDGWRGAIEYTPNATLTLRAGVLTHNAAAPPQTVTPLLPEGARIEGTLGVGFQVTPFARIDLAYQYIKQQTRRGRVTDAVVGQPTAALNTGLYAFKANLFGASVALAF